MDLWLVFVAVGAATIVGAGGTWAARAIRTRWFQAELAPPREPGVPTFRVVALGLQGAGKTVLLASQFHRLSGLGQHRQFFFDSDLRQEQYLEWIFGQVSDTSESWPPGSIGDSREFLFDCKARDPHGNVRRLFRISYLDYPGELLEPTVNQQEGPSEIQSIVDGAHALLIIIDGRRALQLLRGEREGDDYFERRMRPLLRLAGRASCPVQLIITKWDLFQASGDGAHADEPRLLEVKQRLTECAGIEHLVHATGPAQRKVRLIPVSAVGARFADPRPDGTTAKRPGAAIEPFNVEVPLFAVLPDLLKHLEHSLLPAEVRRTLDAELHRSALRDIPKIVHAVLKSPAGRLLRKALGGVVGDEIVKLFVDMLVRGEREEVPASPSERGDHLGGEEDLGQLRAAVVKHMEHEVLLVEVTLPSSVLRSWW